MPDGMTTPEKPGVPISPSVQAARTLTWTSELPEIRMQLTNDQGRNEEEITNLFRWMSSMRMTTTSSGRFGTELNKLEGVTTEEEKELSREKMRRLYGTLMGQCLDAISSVYDNSVDQKKNAAPFEDKGPRMTIEAVRESLMSLSGEEWFRSKEAGVWIERAEEDLDFLDAFLRTTSALSASLPGYYDIIVQLSTLKDHYRAYATEETIERTYAGQLEGLCLRADKDKAKQAVAEKQKIGLEIEDKYKLNKESLIKPGETLGLREVAIRMQDASFESRMKLAAVSQADFLADKPEETTFMGDNLTGEEMVFYRELFWRHKDGKGAILTPYVTLNAKDRKEILAKMEAMLTTNATERLESLRLITDQEEKETKLSNLIKDVKAEALSRISNWHRRGKDTVSKLAVLLTRGGLLQDYSLMHAYRYCWSYVWEVESEGKPTGLEKTEIGGIYTPSGDIPSLCWAQRKHRYDMMGNSATPFLLPTSREGRADLRKLPPHEMPRYAPELTGHPDAFLREQWLFIFGNDSASKQARAKMGYVDIEPSVAEKLKRWAFVWKTPFRANFLGESQTYELEVPHFMPPGLDTANFFESVTVQKGKLNEGAKSVWQELVEGKKLSEIDWSGMDFQQIDRWLVDCEMASRYLRILIEIFDKEKDPFFTLVTGDPSTLGPKELAKRLRLSLRDSPEGKVTMYEIALIPFFVTLACANKHGIFGAAAWESTSTEDKETNTCAADRFFIEMAYWKRAFKWLPGDRPGLEDLGNLNYGNTMALLAEFYEAVISRVAKASSEEAYPLSMEDYARTVDRLNARKHLYFGRFRYKLNRDRALLG